MTSLLVMACSASRTSTFGSGGEGGEGGEGSGNGSGSPVGAGGILVGVGGGSSTGVGCSPDLKKVVDENGNVQKECPPDQGCFGGACIAACEAAAKSKGSIGCDFLAPDPPFTFNGQGSALDGPCYAVFLANAWDRSAKIAVSRNGQMLDATSFARIPKGVAPNVTYDALPPEGIPPNEVAVLFLSHKPGVVNGNSLECPYAPAIFEDAAVSGSGMGNAFRVLVDTPVSAYDIIPYGGAKTYLPSATLLLPTSAFGTNFYAVAPRNDNSGALWALVAASEDNTKVKVAPVNTLPGGSIPQAPGGQTTEYMLNAGQTLQWLSPSNSGDPSSAVFESDKPIGLWTGNNYLRVSTNTSPGGGGQDAAHQQVPHVNALGSVYVGAGIVTRMPSLAPESIPYRLLGVVDGTTLTWDPMPPGAPTTLSAGQVVEFETTAFFSVESQDKDHPFAFTQYMPGTITSGTRDGCGPEYSGGGCQLGDEEWVSLVPAKQFLQRYVFFTDPTYPTTNLVITRVKGANGFSEVNIACLGKVTGWQPVGSGGMYEFAHVDLVRGGVALGQCGTSRHEATSDGAFGVTVWGTDFCSSYGYPAGGNLGTINNVSVPVPEPK